VKLAIINAISIDKPLQKSPKHFERRSSDESLTILSSRA